MVDLPGRTALCVDARMPTSADLIAEAMLKAFPKLENRWHYVEAPLETIEPSNSCLLAAVHACGGLSDTVIGKAISGNAPIALVPCCHTMSERKGFMPHPFSHDKGSVAALKFTVSAVSENNAKLGSVVDSLRMTALSRAGFRVEEEFLPYEFTAQNRLILGFASSTKSPYRSALGTQRLGRAITKNLFTLPTSDDEASIALCAEAAGRKAAAKRKAKPSPFRDVSCWLHEANNSSTADPPLTAIGLEKFANLRLRNLNSSIIARVTVQDSYNRSIDGRRAETYRIVYEMPITDDGALAPADTDRAKLNWLHGTVISDIETRFPGTKIRT